MHKSFRLKVSLLLCSSLLLLPADISHAGELGDTTSLYSKIEKIVKKSDEWKKFFWESDTMSTGWALTSSGWSLSDEAIMDTGSSDENSWSRSGIGKWIEAFYSKLVLETYKSQFKKNLKDLDVTLKKIYPEKDDRIEAYKKIKQTYENILKNLKNTMVQAGWASISKKQLKIYEESLTYLISLITLRITTLES